MTGVLRGASIILAGMSLAMLVVLVTRRQMLSIAERRSARLERKLQPLALDVIDGEVDTSAVLSGRESRTLAVIVARYSRRLAGDARANVAGFFEQSGAVRREVKRLRAHRTWRRATAAFLLGDMAAPSVIPALIAALDDRRREVRSAAARSLGILGAREAVPQLVECFAARSVPRAVAGFALLTIGETAREQLRALVTHDDAEVRAAATELLGFVGLPTDAPLLTTVLADPSAEVRTVAAVALGRLGDDTAAGALRTALEDRIPFVRTAAAQSLAALDDIDATEALEQQARTDTFEPAQAAARALALISPEQAIACGRAPGASPHLIQAASMAEFTR